MKTQDVLAEAVLMTKPLVARYLAGFDDSNCTRQAATLPNHAAWSLGHLALTMHRVGGMIDAHQPPAADFSNTAGEAGRAAGKFYTESVAFGSRPGEEADAYPTLVRSREIFDAACDRLAAAARSASDAKLQESVPWGQSTTPLWTLCLRMNFHNGMHTGQLADLRRAFGFKSVFS